MPCDDRHTRLDLAQSLLLEAGRLLEDSSPEFALAVHDADGLAHQIEHLIQVADDLKALAAASHALLRQSSLD